MSADMPAPEKCRSGTVKGSEAGMMAFVLIVDAESRTALEARISDIPGASLYLVGSQWAGKAGAEHTRPSDRLAQILPLVVEGNTNKQIGRLLGISHFTVRNHVARLLRLYGARNRAELLAMFTSRANHA